jgi:hypothetical protein
MPETAPQMPGSYDVPNVENEKTGLLSSEQNEGGPGLSLAYKNGTTKKHEKSRLKKRKTTEITNVEGCNF